MVKSGTLIREQKERRLHFYLEQNGKGGKRGRDAAAYEEERDQKRAFGAVSFARMDDGAGGGEKAEEE